MGSFPPVVLRSSLRDGKIVSEASPDEIAALVSEGEIVILKGAFETQMMLDYRKALMGWARDHATFPHGQSPSAFPDLNFHRIDDGVIGGHHIRLPSYFSSVRVQYD